MRSFEILQNFYDYIFLELLYRAPELLRAGPLHLVAGSVKGDIYSFGIILYEICTRKGKTWIIKEVSKCNTLNKTKLCFVLIRSVW